MQTEVNIATINTPHSFLRLRTPFLWTQLITLAEVPESPKEIRLRGLSRSFLYLKLRRDYKFTITTRIDGECEMASYFLSNYSYQGMHRQLEVTHPRIASYLYQITIFDNRVERVVIDNVALRVHYT